MHGLSGETPIGDGLDGGGGAAAEIPAGKDIAQAGVHGGFVHNRCLPTADRQYPAIDLLLRGGEELGLRHLRNGGDDGIIGLGEEFPGRLGTAAAAGIRIAQLHFLDLHFPQFALDAGVFHRIAEIVEDHALVLRGLDLKGIGRHFFLGAAINDADRAAEADGGAGAVNGGIAAADDGDFAAQRRCLAQSVGFEEIHAQVAAVQIRAFDRHRHGFLRAHGQIDGVVLTAELLELQIFAQLDIVADAHAIAAEQLDLAVQNGFGQTIFRDAVTQPAPCLRGGFKDADLMSQIGKIIAAGQAGRTGADDGDLFARGIGLLRDVVPGIAQILVRGEALQLPDGDGILDDLAPAFLFAESRADTSDGKRQRQGFLDHLDGVVVLAVGDQRHVALHVHVVRAGDLARGLAIGVVIGDEQFQRHLARGADVRAVGVDLHTRSNERAAGGDEAAAAGDFNRADPAGAVGLEFFVVAEGGDLDAMAAGQFEDRDAGFGLDFGSV